MGREREADPPPEGCGYLRGVLEDAARPFMFRQGVRILLGMIEGGVVAGIIPHSFFRSGFLPATGRGSTRSGPGTSRSLAYGPPSAGHNDLGHAGEYRIVGAGAAQEPENRPNQVPGGLDRTVKDLSGRPATCQPEEMPSNRDKGVIAGRGKRNDDADETLIRQRDRIQRYRISDPETGDGSSAGETGSVNHENVRWSAVTTVTAGISELLDDAGLPRPGSVPGADARENGYAGGSGQSDASGLGEDGYSSRSDSTTPVRRPVADESGETGPADADVSGPRPRNGFEAPPNRGPLSAIVIPGVTVGKREFLLASIDPAELVHPMGPPDDPERIMPSGDGSSPDSGQTPAELPGDSTESVTTRQASDKTGATALEKLPGYGGPRPATDHSTALGTSGVAEDTPSVMRPNVLGHRREISVRILPDTSPETEGNAGAFRERSRDGVDRLLQAARSCQSNDPDRAGPAGNRHEAEPATAMPTPRTEQVKVITRPARRSAEPAAFWERNSLGRLHLRPLR